MNLTFDQHLFAHVGLDSGSLTMLGSVVHSFREPGEYRASVHKAGGGQAVFYISVDKNSPAAQVNIDLASLREYSDSPQDECCDGKEGNRFTINPKGFVLFHVSKGSGGFSVHIRRSEENPKEKVFNSEILEEGDIFSAVILRPGAYSVINRQAKSTSKAEIVVSYPEVGKTAYRPPGPVRVQVGAKGFEPAYLEVKPGQGMVFEVKAAARIVIELVKADDGPGKSQEPGPRVWSKYELPKKKA